MIDSSTVDNISTWLGLFEDTDVTAVSNGVQVSIDELLIMLYLSTRTFSAHRYYRELKEYSTADNAPEGFGSHRNMDELAVRFALIWSKIVYLTMFYHICHIADHHYVFITSFPQDNGPV